MQGSKIQIVFIYAHLSYLVRQERCVIFSLKYVFIFENNEPLALTLLNRWIGSKQVKNLALSLAWCFKDIMFKKV